MQFSSADLAPLKEALLSGASSISSQGRTVTFRSQDEIKQLIAEIESSLPPEEGQAPQIYPNKVKATFRK